jgi:HK97 family phage major capsid protein
MVSSEIKQEIARYLQDDCKFSTISDLDKAVSDIVKKTYQRESREGFSLSRMIRGLRAIQHAPINADTAEADVQYVKALTTGSSPGSFLVPTVQADQITQFLTIGGVLRSSGVTVLPMSGIQKLNVPAATVLPSWVWTAQNSVQTPTDPNLGQLSFNLVERRCLVAVPNQLIAVSVPAFDTLLRHLLGYGAAEHEDQSFFNTTTLSGGPVALYASSAGYTSINVNNSANGGNLSFTDLINVLATAMSVKASGPFAWYMSPRTFFARTMGMLDLSSRPLCVPTLTEGLYNQVQYKLLGYPVYVSPFIPEKESNGSGTNQSHIIFTNPSYLHIANDTAIEIAYSLERFFDANQTAIRGCNHEDFGLAPAAGVIVLKGVN